jgi:hypothetical protein
LKLCVRESLATSPVPKASGKEPIDVFNLLNRISYKLDIINGQHFTPSSVFSQSMRILADMDIILSRLNIRDNTKPAVKVAHDQPKDVFLTSLTILHEIQRLQSMAGIEHVEFGSQPNREISPSDVFNISGMILAELQPVKAHLDLRHAITPPANFFQNRSPGNVNQVLGWVLKKLRQIRSLDY